MSKGGITVRNRFVLITNNLSLHRSVVNGRPADADLYPDVLLQFTPFSPSRFIEGSSLDVLIAVRDAVHLGGRLLTHPLCGNLRPHQQPFRSVLIEERIIEEKISGIPKKLDEPRGFPPVGSLPLVDLESLSMIEEAVLVYRGCQNRLLLPERLSDEVRKDYAFIDGELMKESLLQYRILS
ncbi:MAG: GrdX family protein [Synergistaceae bacterium]|jgi:hypothetical protein|nr:GrdX family protein [Synergistaceae bacterium]